MPPTHSWIHNSEFAIIVEAITRYTAFPHAGICHGVRTGNEVRKFREFLGSGVIGTDISNVRFADVIAWDFNRINQEWVDQFDFVYSNSFDHSYDPGKTIGVWAQQLRKQGKLFLHWGYENYQVNRPNCVAGTKDDVVQLLSENDLVVVDCIDTGYDDRYIIIATILSGR